MDCETFYCDDSDHCADRPGGGGGGDAAGGAAAGGAAGGAAGAGAANGEACVAPYDCESFYCDPGTDLCAACPADDDAGGGGATGAGAGAGAGAAGGGGENSGGAEVPDARGAGAVASTLCAANEYVGANACTPCGLGSTNAAGDDSTGANTGCDAVECLANEYVLSNTCVACATGYERAAGDPASGANTACALPPVTGMCAGNTVSSQDVDCGDSHLLKQNPEAIRGATTSLCCDPVPVAAPEVIYTWQATAFAPTVCATTCGANAAQTSTVTCTKVTLYDTGNMVREDETDRTQCTETDPAATRDCPTVAVGATCDDSNDDTMNDKCTAGGCAGEVQLASAASLPLDIADLVVPDTSAMSAEEAVAAIDASPVAVAVKGGLATALDIDASTITIKSIAAAAGGRRRRLQTGITVDYVVALPAAAVAAAQTAAASATPEVTIPAAASTSGAALPVATGTVTPLKSYAYVSASTCGVAACSTACGAAAVSAADVYSCEEDGTAVATALCVPTLGAVPDTDTVCCPAADPATCADSSPSSTEAVVAQPEQQPSGSSSPTGVSTSNDGDAAETADEGGGMGGIITLIVVCVIGAVAAAYACFDAKKVGLVAALKAEEEAIVAELKTLEHQAEEAYHNRQEQAALQQAEQGEAPAPVTVPPIPASGAKHLPPPKADHATAHLPPPTGGHTAAHLPPPAPPRSRCFGDSSARGARTPHGQHTPARQFRRARERCVERACVFV